MRLADMGDQGRNTIVLGECQTPPASPSVAKSRLLERRKTLRKTGSAPALNNLPPLGQNQAVNLHLKSKNAVSGEQSPNEVDSGQRSGIEVTSTDSSPRSSPFLRHRGKHASMPDMRRHLERHSMVKISSNQCDNLQSPRSNDGSPDLLRKVLRRTASYGSDDPSGLQNVGVGSPVICRRHIFATDETTPNSTSSSPLIRRRSSNRLCDVGGVSSLTNSPVPSPRISRRSVTSRQSSRPDTPMPTPRTSILNNNNNGYTTCTDTLAMEKIKDSLVNVRNQQQDLAEDPEKFVGRLHHDSSGEEIDCGRRSSEEDRNSSDAAVEYTGFHQEVIEEDTDSFENDELDADNGIVVLPIGETIDERPEYQKEPESPESRIHKWLVNIDKERWQGQTIILPHISSTS
ncbi:uncharacterized protein [Ptychodera flava]|uniref:uncharacterized protein n=1 Tax=Ptychodera flava TaxID=63121 RepID=UPI00396A7631